MPTELWVYSNRTQLNNQIKELISLGTVYEILRYGKDVNQILLFNGDNIIPLYNPNLLYTMKQLAGLSFDSVRYLDSKIDDYVKKEIDLRLKTNNRSN